MSFQALYAFALWLVSFLAPGHAHHHIRQGVGSGNPKLHLFENGSLPGASNPPNASR